MCVNVFKPDEVCNDKGIVYVVIGPLNKGFYLFSVGEMDKDRHLVHQSPFDDFSNIFTGHVKWMSALMHFDQLKSVRLVVIFKI